MNNNFYTNGELLKIGFKEVGKNVLISKKCSIYSPQNMKIGNNVRIDDFCILSGKIDIGNYIHIASYTALYGGDKGIVMKDFSGISSKCTIYAVSDDYSGKYMTNPMISNEFKNIISKKVVIEKHALIGAGSILLPGVEILEGTAIGAMSLVKKTTKPWKIYAGNPLKEIKDRSKHLLELEELFIR